MPRERTIMLRARLLDDQPTAGMLMASETGNTVYRILEVARLRRAGETATRLRLVCTRLRRCEVPEGAQVHPWFCGRPEPPQRPAVRERPRLPPAETACRIRAARRQAEVTELARVARSGREVSPGPDFGPELRRKDLRDRKRRLLRERDVEIDRAGVDPRNPNLKVTRAVRADPLAALKRAGSIGNRECDAAEKVRCWLEHMTPSMGGGGCGEGVHVAAFLRQPISGQQVKAYGKVRQVAAALGELWPPVLWICLGGTVTGFSQFRHMRLEDAGELVRTGLTFLANYFYGPKLAAA